MRSKVFMAIPFLLLGSVACGGGGSAVPSPAPATAQPLADWFSQAAGPLGKLSTAYIELGTSEDSLTALHDSPAVGDLENAARSGLAVPAPEGRPDLDRAYDQVMTDAVTVSQDIAGDRVSRFNTDADTASMHLDDLKTLLAGADLTTS